MARAALAPAKLHLHFPHTRTGVLRADDQLRRDKGRAGGQELEGLHEGATIELHEVQVCRPGAEQEAQQEIVSEGGDLAPSRMGGAVEAARCNHVGIGKERNEPVQVFRGQRQIHAVVKDPLAAGRAEASGQRHSVVQVAFVVDDANPGILGREPIGDLARPVGASVVDHDDLEFVGQTLQGIDGAPHRALDARLLVETRHDERQSDLLQFRLPKSSALDKHGPCTRRVDSRDAG